MPTPAERLDAAVDALLAGEPRHGGGLVELARLVHDALPPVPAGVRFEQALRRRLTGRSRVAWAQLTPSRLIAAGAVSSAAAGFTALALWRTSRRQPAHRLWHR